jgi:hypothetical protein
VRKIIQGDNGELPQQKERYKYLGQMSPGRFNSTTSTPRYIIAKLSMVKEIFKAA